MTIRGAVYYKPAFSFKDGAQADKLIILLNTPIKENDYLFVPVTSQKKIRSETHGCVKHYNAGEFFIPAGKTFFKYNTWIILAQLYPVPSSIIRSSAGYSQKATLPSKVMDHVIDCLFKHHSDDIPEMYESLIKPQITDWKRQLSEKFSSE